LGSDFAAITAKPNKLETMAEKFGCAAFIGRDVGLRMAKNDAPWRRDLRQGQCVRRSAGRHQKGRDLALEYFAEAAFDGVRPVVIAVATGKAAIRFDQSVENGRRDWRGVVTGKVHLGNLARIVPCAQVVG